MHSFLYPDAPEHFLRAVKALEDRADIWFSSQILSTRPWNVASWLVLTSGVEIVERVIRERGYASSDHKAAMMNLGLDLALLLDTIRKDGAAPENLDFRVTRNLYNEAATAIDTAHRYTAFAYVFPLWYKGQFYAEMSNSTRIRFAAPGGLSGRRVSAYHKGFRSAGFAHSPDESPEPMHASPEEMREMESVLKTCWPLGDNGFFYPQPISLLKMLFESYLDRILSTFRRHHSVSVGSYTLNDFSRFYAALLAICGVHDYLCHRWSHGHPYPLDSTVFVKKRHSWVRLCSRLSSLEENTVDAIIADLTLGVTRPLDLHVHPFVPLSADCSLLAVAPHFPLFSKSEENILRVCSYLRSGVFSLASATKEEEMRQNLQAVINGSLKASGPLKLPSPVPDIDMVFIDEADSTVLICELKWIRKPSAALERIRADEEFLKGLKQLEKIQMFLTQNPGYLRTRKVLSRDLGEYRHIHYLLVARDHFLWAEPTNNLAIVDFQPFKQLLQADSKASAKVKQLLTYEWLPKEGSDFVVRYDPATLNGSTIELETFYYPGSTNMPFRGEPSLK